MNITRKQERLIEVIEKCGFLFRNEVNTQVFPESMVEALIKKGLLFESGSKLISTTYHGNEAGE